MIITGQNVVLNGILSAQKNTSIVGLATIIGVIVNISFNLIFIPKIGVYSAAISTAIAFVCVNSILFYRVQFEGKSMIQESVAMLGLVLLLSVYFYFGRIDISLISIFTKCILAYIYFLFLKRVFNINNIVFYKYISNLKAFQKI